MTAILLLLIAIAVHGYGFLGRCRERGSVVICQVSFLAVLCSWPFLSEPVQAFGLYVDGLAYFFLLLVSFLAIMIFRYARSALKDDPGRDRFFSSAHGCLMLVMSFALMDYFPAMAVLWVLISIMIHRLLTVYDDHPAAQKAALQKMIASRLSEILLVASVIIGMALALPQSISQLTDQSLVSEAFSSTSALIMGMLLILAAALRSALFPFHSWLPASIQTPTPVSAMMHAGLINAGGYLILRTYPLISPHKELLMLLSGIGFISVVTNGLSMMASPDIKRRLGYSTGTQMGFMFLQLGLGAPEAAFLHMVGHAFYKAHSFLNAHQLPPSATMAPSGKREQSLIWAMALSPVLYSLITAKISLASGFSLTLLAMALLSGLHQSLLLHFSSKQRMAVLGLAFFMLFANVWLQASVIDLLGVDSVEKAALPKGFLISLIGGYFGLLGFSEWLLNRPMGRKTAWIYALIHHGFYFDPFWRRITKTP